MWYRVLLPELVPEADRLLYLDVDTIVTDSLTPLWRLDTGGALVGAVTNVLLDKHRHRPGALGLEAEAYFNSGVLLMNLDEMRRAGVPEAIRDYAVSEGPALDWPDQDALNVILGKRRLALHPRWNCMNALWLREARETFAESELAEAVNRPAIRHFEGPGDNKPWHADCRQRHLEMYFAHRRRTPWPVCRREGPRSARLRRMARSLSRRHSVYLSA
jgi:UDP-glucose/galactose:(glucosyl)LPS alpha-1,2-glucosyl/galactosyltransferase